MATWQERAANKRRRIDQTIPDEWKIRSLPTEDSVFDFPEKSGLLSAKELMITGSTATDLVVRLAKGELKAVEVTLAFCKRAALAHQLAGSSVYSSIDSGANECHRLTAFLNFSQRLLCSKRKSSMRILTSIRSRLAHYMGCPSP